MNRAGLNVKEVRELLNAIKSISGSDIRFAPIHRFTEGSPIRKPWIKCQRCRSRILEVDKLDGTAVLVIHHRKQIGTCQNCGQLLLVG